MALLTTAPRRVAFGAWSLRWALTCLFVAPLACSAALKWDPNGLACDTAVRDGQTYFCDAGYSCETYTTQCIRDQSVVSGGLCTMARQCVAGDMCAVDALGGGGVQGQGGVLSCLPECVSGVAPEPYFAEGGCKSETQVCTPYLDELASNSNKSLVGGCAPTAGCTAQQSCTIDADTQGICVQVTAKATSCLVGCEITWNGTAYSDNCDSLHTCQPLGVSGAQSFVCVYNGQDSSTNPLASVGGISVGSTGSNCAAISAPCIGGDVCVPGKNTCAPYCELTSNATSVCPANQVCCPFTTFSAKPASGFCATSCN